jgi:hypothetical protein
LLKSYREHELVKKYGLPQPTDLFGNIQSTKNEYILGREKLAKLMSVGATIYISLAGCPINGTLNTLLPLQWHPRQGVRLQSWEERESSKT